MAVGQVGGDGPPLEGTSAPAARRRRVLVVDDEPALAAMIARMIEDEFDVELAADAHGAMANLTAAREGLPDVILCDLMMPHVSGADLYRNATRALPGIERRFVFMTGGAFTPWVADFLGACQCRWLEKPFAYDALRRILS